ncbi:MULTISPECIES: hypothetical protein [unclassified Chamaesiphon]|uniref:hypothetical protein n=1 Tax=unclassified Chamaesiphon TaxID=2620921 RepID=UPI00286C966E|nr:MULTISPECIES: hypothetical protein [unclassified Chamaesiphon]
MNKFIGATKHLSLYRLFWLVWGIMAIGSVCVAPFSKPLYQNWNITEWLIDYSNGFVRRGLFGTGIDWLRQWNIPPLPLIFGIAITAYVITTWLWIASVRINQSKLSRNELLLLLFNPCLILFFVMDGSPLRKDVFPILFSMISLWMIRSIKPHENKFFLNIVIFSIWEAVSGLILSLSHEGISLFLWLPTHWLLYTTIISKISTDRFGNTTKDKLIQNTVRILVFLPTLIACAAAIKWNGGSETALAICKNWESLIATNCSDNYADTAAIAAVSWNLSQAWNMSGFTLIDNGVVLLWFIPFLFWTGIHLRIASKVSMSPSLSVKVAAWIGMTAFPLYLIGWDWGRWFTIGSMLGLSVILILADSPWLKDLEHHLDLLLSNSSLLKKPFIAIQSLAQFLLIKSTKYLQSSARTIAISSLIGLPHCCATTLGILAKGMMGGFVFAVIRLFALDTFY